MRRSETWKLWLILALVAAVGPLGACDGMSSSSKKDDDEEESDDEPKKKGKGKDKDKDDDDDKKGDKDGDDKPGKAADGAEKGEESGGGGAGGLSAPALKYFPEAAEAVAVIDGVRTRESAVWKMGTDILDELGTVKGDSAKKLEDAKVKMEELEKELGFHPLKDLSRVSVAIAGIGKKDTEAIVVVEGKGFDADKIVAYGKKHDEDGYKDKTEKVGDVTVHWDDDEKGGWALVSPDLLVGGTKAWLKASLEGKGKNIEENPKLMSALKRVDGNAGLFVAMPITADMTAKMKDMPVKGLEAATDLTVAVVFDEGMKALATFDFGKDATAKEVRDQLDALAKMMSKEMGKDGSAAFPCKKEVMKIAESYALSTTGTAVVLTIPVSKALLDDTKACVMKAAKDLLPEMPLDDLPMMDDSSSKIGDKPPAKGKGDEGAGGGGGARKKGGGADD